MPLPAENNSYAEDYSGLNAFRTPIAVAYLGAGTHNNPHSARGCSGKGDKLQIPNALDERVREGRRVP